MENPIWEYWYFYLPNYLMALLMYTLLGRVLLGFFFPSGTENYIMRFFERTTNWLVRAVAMITPRMVHPIILILLSATWILFLRFGFLAVLYEMGVAPPVTGTPQGGQAG